MAVERTTSPRRFAYYGAIMTAALGLIPGGGHVLEMPPRLLYEPELYMTVTSTMYSMYGAVGAVIQIFAVTMGALLAILLRGTPAFRASLLGTALLGLSILIWFTVVGPVNAEWMEALARDRAAAVEAYAALRSRWEYGHLAAFAAWFAGFSVILWSVFLHPPRPAT